MTAKEFDIESIRILKDVPEELRSCIAYMAYEHGHSSGYGEVLQMLEDLIYHLKPGLDKLVLRLSDEKISSKV